MNSILRSIRHVFIVAALLLVTVVPMSAPPSANARPDVGLGAASVNSRLAYQVAKVPTNQIIIKYKATADISGVKAPAHCRSDQRVDCSRRGPVGRYSVRCRAMRTCCACPANLPFPK